MSVEKYFASLSKRQTMLLLTGVTFGGQEALAAFDFLPPDDAELLKHRAAEMLQIPREKRIPLLVQEIKRLVTARRGDLRTADPESLAVVLRKERAALVEVVLKALPSKLAEEVRAQLPKREVTLLKEVKPEVLSIVRWKLEDVLAKAAGRRGGTFKFSDVLVLQARELLTVCDRMGARALATAIAGLPDAERETFFNALPPDQRSLATKASQAGMTRKLNEADARSILEIHDGVKNPSAGMRSAGTQRLARACLAQSPEFAARVLERHPGEFGRLLSRWLKEERNRPVSRGDGGRADIVEQMERLAHKGIVERPMRLPPPQKRPLGPGGGQPLPGGKLLPPAPRQAVASSPGQPGQAGGHSQRPPAQGQRPGSERVLAPAPPRRDFMAEREARKAGAVSSREQNEPRRDPIAEREARRAGVGRPAPRDGGGNPPRGQDSRSDPRVLRDGKPLEEGQRKPLNSPHLQNPPQRKGPAPQSTAVGRAPKPTTGSRAGIIKGSDRGPKGGSG